jgi:hypothetical protein
MVHFICDIRNFQSFKSATTSLEELVKSYLSHILNADLSQKDPQATWDGKVHVTRLWMGYTQGTSKAFNGTALD